MTDVKNENKNNSNNSNDKNTISPGSEINLLGKIKSYVKSGSYKIQEKKKNTIPINNEKIHVLNANKPPENNHIFRIEEDENAKEFAYHLNDNDSEEDEGYIDESDEEEKDSKTDITENREQSHNKQENKKENSINDSKKTDYILDKGNDGSKASIEMRNLSGENNNNSVSTNETSSKFDIKENVNIIESVEENPDSSQVCHRIIFKGYEINLSDFNTVKLKKYKQKSGLLSYIGFSKNKVERNYRCFFDEYFIYMLKDNIINKNDSNLRKIGNKYDLRLIKNISLNTHENEEILVSLEFLKSMRSEDSFNKDLYFTQEEAKQFLDYLNINLRRLNINFSSNEEEEEEEQQKNNVNDYHRNEEFADNNYDQNEGYNENDYRNEEIEDEGEYEEYENDGVPHEENKYYHDNVNHSTSNRFKNTN